MARHYLDHASTSPARPEAVAAAIEWMTGLGSADPGRVHTEGRMARAALEDAREQVTALFAARPREVVFTSGATEAINSAVWGAARQRPGAAVVAAAVEHSAVRDSAERAGPVAVWPVDGLGRVDLDFLDDVLSAGPPPALVCCQWGNHEVGTIQPVAEVVQRCRAAGVPVLVDAAAAAGHVPIAFTDLGADLMAVSAHKLGGPKGVGALLVRRGLRFDPLIVGGDQERARRAGLENVPGCMGFGAVAQALAGSALDEEAARARSLTDRLVGAALEVDGVAAYGDQAVRLPHLVCVGVPGVESEAVLLGLDQAGVAAHSGSACSSESLEPSPVLAAMGVDAQRSLRLSVGWDSTDDDVTAFAAAFPQVVSALRGLRT